MKTKHKYRRVIDAFFAHPWQMLPEKFDDIVQLLEVRSQGLTLTPEEIEERIGGNQSRQEFQADSDVAVLNVFGTLAPRMNSFMQISGGTSLEQLSQAIDEVARNDEVKTVVTVFDSPGGNVALLQETAAKLVELGKSKRTIGIANTLAASAAYRLLIANNEVVLTPSGMVGSIGTMMAHQVTTEAQEKAGISYQVFRMPENKAEGSHGEAISQAGQEHAQRMVETFYNQFATFVSQRRGISLKQILNFGDVFLAEDALKFNLVDRVATLDSILSDLGIGLGAEAPSDRPAFSMEGIHMKPELFGALHRAGMVAITATQVEAEAALQRFFAAQGRAVPATEEEQLTAVEAYLATQRTAPSAPATPATPTPPAPAATSTRAAEIMAAVRLVSAQLPDTTDALTLAQELSSAVGAAGQPLTMLEVTDRIQEVVAAAVPTITPPVITPGAAPRDRMYDTARDSLLLRQFGARRPERIWDAGEQDFVDWSPQRPDGNLQSLPRLAEECLVMDGFDRQQVNRLHPQQIASLALGIATPASLGVRAASDGPSYNVSGMFPLILLDAANVTARESYNEVEVTFPIWTRRAADISDFKEVHRIISGEMPNPKAVPEDGEFEETTLGEAREKYRLVVWGSMFSLTWEMTVNDQLGEFMKIPAKMAVAMRRKQNILVYNILKDNPTLAATSTALFDASTHDNLTTGAVSGDYTGAWNTMAQKMAEQAGLDSGTTLNLDPRYVLFPPALRGDILQFLGSNANPSVGGDATGSSGVTNIWQGGLQPVQEAQLGAGQGGSDVAFYHAADPNLIDTIEYAYLAGLSTPATDRTEAFTSLGIKFRIYQAFKAAPIDYRGLQKHAGA